VSDAGHVAFFVDFEERFGEREGRVYDRGRDDFNVLVGNAFEFERDPDSLREVAECIAVEGQLC
jgi:hypothetical protein